MAIEGINAGGVYIPAFLILLGKVYMSNWYHVKELEGDIIIAVIDSGYFNTAFNL